MERVSCRVSKKNVVLIELIVSCNQKSANTPMLENKTGLLTPDELSGLPCAGVLSFPCCCGVSCAVPGSLQTLECGGSFTSGGGSTYRVGNISLNKCTFFMWMKLSFNGRLFPDTFWVIASEIRKWTGSRGGAEAKKFALSSAVVAPTGNECPESVRLFCFGPTHLL